MNGNAVNIVEVYVQSGDDLYMALLSASRDTHVPPRAEASLLSLCPPMPLETAAQQQAPAPLTPPAHWIAGHLTAADAGDGFALTNRWMRLGPNSNELSYLTVQRVSNIPGSMTPQEVSNYYRDASGFDDMKVLDDKSVPLCHGDQGWLNSTSGMHGGRMYISEEVFSQRSSVWYIARYVRSSGDPEDPAARTALLSLCPA
jgi:hypothetical protein